MRILSRLAALVAAAALQACATAPAGPPPAPAALASAEARARVTILISIDGFRPDYLDRGVTPVLSRLAAGGVRATMRPAFPTKTFPNHYTLVTGRVPDRNGIVANRMEDPRRPGETFTATNADPFWWNEATPVWVDAEKAGIRTATMFWPGSNVAIGGERAKTWPNAIAGGTRPGDWYAYDEAVSYTQRIETVLDLMRRPVAIRPRFVTLYLEGVDAAGHDFGPDDPHVTDAAAQADAAVGTLVAGLAALGQPADLVVVSDHGMAQTANARTIALDRVATPSDYRIIDTGTFAALAAMPGRERALEAALLRAHPHMQCWRKSDIPARFDYGRNPRVAPYFCLAETGWRIERTTPSSQTAGIGGNHGYDNRAPEMAAIFIANGPAFAAGRTLATFDNVDVYPLLRDLIGLPPAQSDGSDAPFRAVLRR